MADPALPPASLVDALRADSALGGLIRSGAALLVWRDGGRQLAFADAATQNLARAIIDEEGRLDAALPLAERLIALAAGAAPRMGARLEKLRFSASRLSPLVTCACRLLEHAGETLLVMLISGPLPRIAPAVPRPAMEAPPQAAPDPSGERGPGSDRPPDADAPDADPLAALQGRGTVRFVWQSDAEARFTSVSEALGTVVGAAAATLVGRGWDEIAGTLVLDADGRVSGYLARAETFSGVAVLWRIAGSDHGIEVSLAGSPVLGPDRTLLGFRGFGLCRTDRIEPWPAQAAEQVSEGPAPSDAPASDHASTAPMDAPEIAANENDAAEGLVPDDASVNAIEASAPDPAAPADAPDLAPAPHVKTSDENALGTQPSPEVLQEALSEAAGPAPQEAGDEPTSHRTTFNDPDRANGEAPGHDSPEAEPRPPGEPAEGDPVAAQAPSFGSLDGAVAARLGPGETPPLRAVDPPPAGANPGLTVAERLAFREIARALGARPPALGEPAPPPTVAPPATVAPLPIAAPPSTPPPAAPAGPPDEPVLDQLPVGVLALADDAIVFANRFLLDLLDFDDAAALAARGGLEKLFRGRRPGDGSESGTPYVIVTRAEESLAVEARTISGTWGGTPAQLIMVRKIPEDDPGQRLRALELDLRRREEKARELAAILDTATDGVAVLDEDGRILSLNRSAEALFGYDQNEVTGEAVTTLFAPESHAAALDYLDGVKGTGVASLLNDGREVMGRVRQRGSIPLFMTMGRITDGPERRFCAVFRDITAFKKAEGELLAAKRAAEEASAQKSDVLARISHEIRTPLNAIIGFAEVMREERFGPIGNERYRDYVSDIHESGGHVISLVNDFLDLAKIEAGRMELAFVSVNLNELVSSCVSLLQTQAQRDRIVMRTSFSGKLPPVVADERSLRQIALNLISNAIKFTDAGGQVIVSTAVTDRGEVALRVRDTGIGMSGEEVEAALEPFRQLSTTRGRGGTGLGLPLTKALVEANRGAMQITSAKNEGTLVEVLFPPTRVLA
ncbi:MAG TPA: ATP-binding protein [Beijerinckiaceae bacterium]|jgi:PAS domain S-box-containing protein